MKSADGWAVVGDRVRRARLATGYSQTNLAQRLNLDRTALVRVESGTRHVSALELSQLAQVLDLPVAYFVSQSPEPVAAYRASVADAGEDSDEAAEAAKFFLDVELEDHGRDAEWLRQRGFLEPADPLRPPAVESRDDALTLARTARSQLDTPSAPLGSLATVSEKFGLFIKVVARGTSGASLQLEEGFGVAVLGAESDPGRRRSTAAHELGHHLWGDQYNTDAGIATADDEKERLVDAFASEFLLPGKIVERAPSTEDLGLLRNFLIKLAAEYRVSWSVAVNSAKTVLGLDENMVRRLRAQTPLRGDFLEVVGEEPRYDLSTSSTGPRWRRAVLAAYKAKLLTPERTLEMVNGSLQVTDLPGVDDTYTA